MWTSQIDRIVKHISTNGTAQILMKFYKFLQSELETVNIPDGEQLQGFNWVLTEEVIAIFCHLTNVMIEF